MTAPDPQLVLLFMAHPLTGHITPTLRIASHFSSLGHDVYFLGPTSHESRIKSAGCTFIPLLGSADINDLTYYTPSSTSTSPTDWQTRALQDFRHLWIDTIPDEFRSFTAAVTHIQDAVPLFSARRFLVVCEAMFLGILPYFLNAGGGGGSGADLPNRIKTIALSIMVPFIRSPEIGPGFADSLPFLPDRAQQTAQAAKQWSDWEERTAHLSELMDEKLMQAGAQFGLGRTGPFLSGANYTLPHVRDGHSRILQLGVPSFFYPREEGFPPNFRFVGVLPPAAEPPATGWANLPSWWREVTSSAAARTKKIVVVAQGTVEVDPRDLIIPTVSAMASRTEDVLVVAILGRKGATLPRDFNTAPKNVRVTDYLHYDAILPYASAWVHNGGYGAVQHGIAHGVPMVVTGEGQDKADNAKRIAWSGIGVNLGAVRPDAEKVKVALEAVLDEEKYKKRVSELLDESKKLDCFRLAEEEILAVAHEE
ncbi:UDP-Glycosyltransferase/glycogen phosphorylase [Cladorrhinum sp. PSN332]|nr:UDP-Glycosyltransferase/glycogen phosphorylase [Cladorrhinum sp. PSN332]